MFGPCLNDPGKRSGRRLERLSKWPDKDAASVFPDLAIDVVRPPLQHPAALGKVFGTVVDTPHPFLLVGQGLFDPEASEPA
jgi:hypothetical protein